MRLPLKLKLVRVVQKLSARNCELEFRLLDLPNELIAQIVEQVDSIKALRRLSRTCRRLQVLAEPILYRNLFMRWAGHVEKILSSLNARPQRSAAIHRLEIPCDPGYQQNFETLSRVITRAKNVKELYFESPECNRGNFEDDDDWGTMTNRLFSPFQAAAQLKAESALSTAPLQKLQKLTLHLNGCESPYWAFDERSITILLLPALQSLKISCVDILGNMKYLIRDTTASPLKHLELEECNITHAGLSALLSVPKALESLYLGENCYNIRNFPEYDVNPLCNHLFETNASATITALAQQKQSLKTLTYATTETYYQHRQLIRRMKLQARPVDGGFADFHVLDKVRLNGSCPAFERALMSSQSPPNLKTLEYMSIEPFEEDRDHHPDESPFTGVPFLRAPSCSVPHHLSCLVMFYQVFHITRVELPDNIKQVMRAAAKAALKIGAGVEFRIFARNELNYFPPLLFGEPHPVQYLLYGGANVGFVGRRAEGANVARIPPTDG